MALPVHRSFSQPTTVDSVKHIRHNIPFSGFYKNGKKNLTQGGFIGTILIDLSKVYNGLPNDLLIAKLEAYDLDNGNLNLLLDYLSFRKQRTTVGFPYSKWSKN